MTIPQIRIALNDAGKPLSRPQLYVYIKRLGIEPLGARQIPQQYPKDTPKKILARLGLVPARTLKPVKLARSRR
jgi:hypothetical protein